MKIHALANAEAKLPALWDLLNDAEDHLGEVHAEAGMGAISLGYDTADASLTANLAIADVNEECRKIGRKIDLITEVLDAHTAGPGLPYAPAPAPVHDGIPF